MIFDLYSIILIQILLNPILHCQVYRMLHPSYLLNPTYLSILSTQPNLISDSFLAKKYTLDMFPRTHIEGLSRVDRFTFILWNPVFSILPELYFLDIKQMVSTCNERGGLMSFTLSVVGNTSKALFALSVGGNISTLIQNSNSQLFLHLLSSLNPPNPFGQSHTSLVK